ncbi:MAG: hypothetical protein J3Q66DRAFT_394512 [Benniella sp.]|nr:MAG: hypothetical protein J3Q66DRAFT_394512 [Benniella sp.]
MSRHVVCHTCGKSIDTGSRCRNHIKDTHETPITYYNTFNEALSADRLPTRNVCTRKIFVLITTPRAVEILISGEKTTLPNLIGYKGAGSRLHLTVQTSRDQSFRQWQGESDTSYRIQSNGDTKNKDANRGETGSNVAKGQADEDPRPYDTSDKVQISDDTEDQDVHRGDTSSRVAKDQTEETDKDQDEDQADKDQADKDPCSSDTSDKIQTSDTKDQDINGGATRTRALATPPTRSGPSFRNNLAQCFYVPP